MNFTSREQPVYLRFYNQIKSIQYLRAVINTANHLAQTECNDRTAFGLNAMIGWATCLSVCLPPSSSQSARSCVLGKWRGGGIICFKSFRTPAKIARFVTDLTFHLLVLLFLSLSLPHIRPILRR